MSHNIFLWSIALIITLAVSLGLLYSIDPQLPEFFVVALKIIAGLNPPL